MRREEIYGAWPVVRVGGTVKASFCVEAVGLCAGEKAGGGKIRWPWLAEITGRDRRFGYARTFLNARRDYTHANKRGTRGIWFYWTLEHGRVYETQYWKTWDRKVNRFLTVSDDGDTRFLTAEEVEQWLAAIAD